MGGYGSGNRYRFGKKDTVEECRELDVRDWSRKGYLEDTPVSLTINWSRGTEQIAAIGATVSRRGARLSYSYWMGSDESNKKSRAYTVPITWTACNFGGERPWFICAGVVNGIPCNRRVAKLYLKYGYFFCRHCHDLSYESRQTGSKYVPLRKCQRIRQRLGGSANMTEPFPRCPEGMQWRTYWKLWQEHDREEQEYNRLALADLHRLNHFFSSIGKGK